MVDFGALYALDDTVIPAAGLRRQVQRQAGTGSGVARADDLKITQLDTPGTGVKVAAGDDLIQSREPGQERETYSVPLFTAQNYLGDAGTGIPGTGSGSGRRDMIIHEVLDPTASRHFTPVEDWPVGATSKLSVVSGVASTAKTVADVVALNEVTCYELAAINWPESTGTITDAMIEDLRRVQSPHRAEVLYARPRIANDDGSQMYLNGLDSSGGEYFPGGAGIPNEFQVDIPEWATRMVVDADWMGIFYAASKNPYGAYWMEFGDESRPHTWPNNQQWEFATQKFGFNAPLTADVRSDSWRLMDEVAVPVKLRGKRVTFVFKGGRKDSTGSGSVWMGSSGGLGCRITFAEVAAGSDLL